MEGSHLIRLGLGLEDGLHTDAVHHRWGLRMGGLLLTEVTQSPVPRTISTLS